MDELRIIAKELLESGKVQLIIGYEQGSGNNTRAAFIDSADETGKQVFDSRCVQNLAVYLTRKEIRQKGKPAIVAPVPVMRSIIQLASENQVGEGSIVVLGITPELQLMVFDTLQDIEKYLEQYKIRIAERDLKILEELEGMDAGERWQFWLKTLEPCFKCYACRAACPLCYCTQCTVENNRPQWVPVASHKLGNIEWHIMRALHMAGRCTDCEACANACPIGIPLNLLTKKMRLDMESHFGEFSPLLTGANMMSSFKPDDKDNFIK